MPGLAVGPGDFDRPLDFRADVGVRADPGVGVVVYDERGYAVHPGDVAVRVSSLVDGRRTADDLARALGAECGAADVYYEVLRFEAGGWLGPTDAGNGAAPAAARYREALGAARAALDAGGVLPAAPCEADGSLVVSGPYADDVLDGHNARALAAGRSWMPVRVGAWALWLGPWVVPGETACWACLRHAVTRGAGAAAAAARASGVALRTPRIEVAPAVRAAAGEVGAAHVALGRVRGAGAPAAGAVIVVDARTGAVTRHPVRRRPQCPACGDASLYTRRAAAPFALGRRPAVRVSDGGVRAEAPETWLARHSGLVDPVTGLVAAITAVGGEEPSDGTTGGPVCAFVSGPNVYRPSTALAALAALAADLRSENGGKGRSPAQARAGALAEAVERASAAWHGDEPVERASARVLAGRGERVILPNDVLRFSDAQYAARDRWNAGRDATARVPRPLDPEQPLDWSPAWSLTRGERAWLPAGQLYLAHPAPPEERVTVGCSNGLAAGASREDAFLQALLELVERDAVALWWYNRLRRPGVPLDVLGGGAGAFARDAVAWWRMRGRELWALDLTHDLGIPVVAALSRRCGASGPDEQILFGFGAHLRPGIALERAVGELAQVEGAWRAAEARRDGESTLSRWLRTGTLTTEPYLAALDAPGAVSWHERIARAPEIRDVGEAAERCRATLEAAGLEVLALDLTRPDYDVPVVRAIVPGLRHFWPRFAPGRLYDVPVRLGWLDAPTAEAALNPVPFFL